MRFWNNYNFFNKHYPIGFRLTQDETEKFEFIKEGFKGLKIKRGKIPSYGKISKSDVIRECLMTIMLRRSIRKLRC